MEKDNNETLSRKVCIVTWYKSTNYGTVLQCYALMRAIQKLGFDTYVAEHTRYFSIREPMDFLRRVWLKIKHHYRLLHAASDISKIDPKWNKEYEERAKRVRSFIDSEIKTYKLPNRHAFKKMCDEIDIFVTGSDQIWNPNCLSVPMLLSFTADKNKRIAYSSSIGVLQIPKNLQRKYKKYLSRFSAIGVREKSAKQILQPLLDLPVHTVLDPVFLLSQQEWHQMAALSEISGSDEMPQPNGFIFCYFIGSKDNWIGDAQNISKKLDIPVINCLSESYVIPSVGQSFACFGPRDFIWLIQNARMVLTDSFHAAALSIINHKELLVYKRFEETDKGSQNSRIVDLLKLFQIYDRLAGNAQSGMEVLDRPIDYCQVDKILEEEKRRSMQFLVDALKG